jgi:RNA polymerase sigma factor (sigma-70 family)
MRYQSPVAVLLENAARGVDSAWREIVKRYSPLIFSVCRTHGVMGADADDVRANVWLRLVANLIKIREPEALPGWLMTTTRRECVALLRNRQRQIPDDREFTEEVEPGADTALLVEERRHAVLSAVAKLPQRDRDLLTMLFSDPPASYLEISSSLGIPVGAIGPTRQRCLARARRAPSIAALLIDDRHIRSEWPSQRLIPPIAS